jgi:hypothetical protein
MDIEEDKMVSKNSGRWWIKAHSFLKPMSKKQTSIDSEIKIYTFCKNKI